MAVNVTLSPLPILQFFDNTGKPAVGGTLLTQVGGVNYATYSDAAGTTALPNPIPLNSRGEVSTAAGASSELFLEDNVTYTFTLKDADGNQLWSIGNITSDSYMRLNYAAATGTNNLTATITGINAYEDGLTVRLKFAATNTDTMTININSLGAINAYQTNGTSAVIGGQAILDNIGDFEYNSSLNSGAGGFVFLNPANTNEYTIFTASGNFTPKFTATYAIQAIGGGGGGAGGAGTNAVSGQSGLGGNGGTAAQIAISTISLTAGTVYAVVIGAAGSAGAANSAGGDGGDTQFNAVTLSTGAKGGQPNPIAVAAVGANGVSGGNGSGHGGGLGGLPLSAAGNGNNGTAAVANSGAGGGGGSGGHSTGSVQTGGAGGAGGTGLLVIWRVA